MSVPGLYRTDGSGGHTGPLTWQATELRVAPPDEQTNPYFPLDGDLGNFSPTDGWRAVRNDATRRDAEFRGHNSLEHFDTIGSTSLMWLVGTRLPGSVWDFQMPGQAGLPIPAPLTAMRPAGAPERIVSTSTMNPRQMTGAQIETRKAQQSTLEVTFSDVVFKKSLAEGGFGSVALYDVINPDHSITPIVVKFPSFRDPSDVEQAEELLTKEIGFLNLFQGARHVIQPFYDNTNVEEEAPGPFPVNASAPGQRRLFEAPAPGVPNDGEYTAFLATEHMNLGDLYDTIGRVRRARLHWPDRALWSLFFCLVKGVSAMAHPVKWYKSDMDPDWDPRDAQDEDYDEVPPDMKRKPTRIFHFDLDPNNVLLTWDDAADADAPVFKIADFGLSVDLREYNPDKAHKDSESNMWVLRTAGKQNSRAPEQFHETWDYLRYPEYNTGKKVNTRFLSFNRKSRPQIAGRYRHQANIYCIGFIMWCVFTGLWEELPWSDMHVNVPHMPDYTTYGWRLSDPSYGRSHNLRKLVMQCMAANPNHRPNLRKLFRKCREGLAATATAQDLHQTRQWSRAAFRGRLRRTVRPETTNAHMADQGPLKRRGKQPEWPSATRFLTPHDMSRANDEVHALTRVANRRATPISPIATAGLLHARRNKARKLVKKWAEKNKLRDLAFTMEDVIRRGVNGP